MCGDNDYRLTYIHLGIMEAVLINSKAADFIVNGCGKGQEALMSLNVYPGVVCGYCIDPTDAYLYLQINNGNAISIPFAKGYGWGAEINTRFMFERAFGSPSGQGYPPERKESQNINASLLFEVKKAVGVIIVRWIKMHRSRNIKYTNNVYIIIYIVRILNGLLGTILRRTYQVIQKLMNFLHNQKYISIICMIIKKSAIILL